MGMYQSIDDELPGDAEEIPRPPRLRWRWLAGGALLIALLLGAAYLSLPSGTSLPEAASGDDGRDAYLRALSEPSPALRRARLEDFLLMNPDSGRAAAARAQLSVLEAHEAGAWAAVTDALYAPGARAEGKLAALDAYESVWGPDTLSGRGGEIRALRQELEAERSRAPATPPSRALEGEPSPIPESISAGRMAGGPAVAPPAVVLPPVRREATPARVEVPPRVLRAPTPRYPRSAQRRGVEGVVELSMAVDAQGRVEDVRIVSVDAPRYGKEFARAARRAAKRTRFSPRTLDGQPVPTANVLKRYRFEL